jgi:hypothetical protein
MFQVVEHGGLDGQALPAAGVVEGGLDREALDVALGQGVEDPPLEAADAREQRPEARVEEVEQPAAVADADAHRRVARDHRVDELPEEVLGEVHDVAVHEDQDRRRVDDAHGDRHPLAVVAVQVDGTDPIARAIATVSSVEPSETTRPRRPGGLLEHRQDVGQRLLLVEGGHDRG